MSNKLPIEISLMNAYAEFVSNGYPKDITVYVIKGNSCMVKRLAEYFNSKLTSAHTILPQGVVFGCNLEVDASVPPNKIIFGTESLEITWNEE